MKLREPAPIRKHICQYRVLDWYDNSQYTHIERFCDDCKKHQSARFPRSEVLPVAMLVYADVKWHDGGINDLPDASGDEDSDFDND